MFCCYYCNYINPTIFLFLVSSALKMSDYENEVGVIQPTGFWDPLGLSDVSKSLNYGN